MGEEKETYLASFEFSYSYENAPDPDDPVLSHRAQSSPSQSDEPLPDRDERLPLSLHNLPLYPDTTADSADERMVDCIGRPQEEMEHGESIDDKYKQHYYLHAVRHMEHRIGRINAVRRGEPVPSWMDYSDERFGAELMDRLGKMDPDHPGYKAMLAGYKRDRVEEIKRWMEEEDILKKELEEKGLLLVKKKKAEESLNEEAFFHVTTPRSDFSESDWERLDLFNMEHYFPTTGIYTLKNRMKLLDVNPETADQIYFDIPRKPEAYAPENVKHPEIWCPAVVKERTDIKYEHLKLMEEVIGKYKFGITKKRFWEVFANRLNLDSINNLSKILGPHEPMNFCREASDIFFCPEKENPYGLIYSANFKGKIPSPEEIFAIIWHDIRTILGNRILYPKGRLLLNSITSDLKRVYDREVEPTQFGFCDWKQLCLHFIKKFNNQWNIGVFDIILGDKSYMPPELVILRKSNLEDFERKNAIAQADYRKCQKKQLAILAGTLNRTNQQLAKEAESKYMVTKQPIVRLPLRRGERLLCFVDNLIPFSPLFLTVVPKALEDTWRELDAKVTNFYLGREGNMAKIDQNEVELVQGLHVIVRLNLHDWALSRMMTYHRAMIINRNSSGRLLKVELYDRDLLKIVSYDDVRLMTPEIYYFAPALSIRIRIHIDPIEYPRAVEWEFRSFFKFTDDEMDSFSYPVFFGGDLYVNLIEEFPSECPVKRFWSAIAEHEPRVLKFRFAAEEDEPPPKLINVKSSLIDRHEELKMRFVDSYENFVSHCEINNIKPLVQKLGVPILDPKEVIDKTKMTQEDVFRSVDCFYEEAVPVEEEKKEEAVLVGDDKIDEEAAPVADEKTEEKQTLPEIEDLELVDG